MSDDLLESVDRLTKQIRVTVWVDETIVRREQKPLLDQLRDRVGNSVGYGRGGGSLPNERVPIDATAFTLLEDIDGRVRSWVLDMTGSPAGPLVPLLRHWYVLFTQKQREESEILDYQRILDGWWSQVRDVIDPPVKQEITSPCPNCGQAWVDRGTGEERSMRRALWALWRDPKEDSEAHCEGCGKRWPGVAAMRSLRIAIDDAEIVVNGG